MGRGLQERGQEVGTAMWVVGCGAVTVRDAVRVERLHVMGSDDIGRAGGVPALKIAVGYRQQGKRYRERPADPRVLTGTRRSCGTTR